MEEQPDEPKNENKVSIFLLIASSEEDFGFLAAKQYGLKRAFNEWYHWGKSTFINDSDEEFEISVTEYVFENETDAKKAIRMIIDLARDIQDHDHAKNTNFKIFRKKDIDDDPPFLLDD